MSLHPAPNPTPSTWHTDRLLLRPLRPAEIDRDLDRHLLAALCEWLQREWSFDCVVYPLNPLNTRQAALLEEAGYALRLAYIRTDGQPWQVYG